MQIGHFGIEYYVVCFFQISSYNGSHFVLFLDLQVGKAQQRCLKNLNPLPISIQILQTVPTVHDYIHIMENVCICFYCSQSMSFCLKILIANKRLKIVLYQSNHTVQWRIMPQIFFSSLNDQQFINQLRIAIVQFIYYADFLHFTYCSFKFTT